MCVVLLNLLEKTSVPCLENNIFGDGLCGIRLFYNYFTIVKKNYINNSYNNLVPSFSLT